ncbi:hypothetical protein ACIQVK_44705 [Streptomyces sp. NPDC090493]|uniref:hypothetical protein n=1 Tax=Streptomyces sp. NPDC090493 TaxID=3365964 RepID=UPI00381BB015
MTVEEVEGLLQRYYERLVAFFARRTRNFPAAEDLTERVLVAAAREQAPPPDWDIWIWNTAHRTYDDYFLEGCGVQP